MIVVSLEVCSLQSDVVCCLVVETATQAVAVYYKRHIVHVLIGELIACELTTTADGELVTPDHHR